MGRTRGIGFAAGAALIGGFALWSWSGAPASRSGEAAARPLAERARAIDPAAVAPAPLPAAAPLERPAADAAAPSSASDERTAASEATQAEAREAFARLVAELAALEASDPTGDALHMGAPALLADFVRAAPLRGAAFREALQAALDHGVTGLDGVQAPLAERVRGALHALWPPLADGEPLPDPDTLGPWERRGLVLGRLAEWAPEGERGLGIDIARYRDLPLEVLTGPQMLGLRLDRIPDEALAQALVQPLGSVASSASQLIDRRLSVFALGTALEQQPWVEELFFELLADHGAYGGQLHSPLIFVLSRSGEPRVQRRLLELLGNPGVDPLARGIGLSLLGDRLLGWDAIVELSRPLLEGRPLTESAGAAHALQKQLEAAARGPDADPETVRRIQALVGGLVADHPDRLVRMGLVGVLADTASEGAARQQALADALHADGDPTVRRLAARGLAATTGSERAAARAELLARLATETDAEVLAELEALLAQEP